MRWIIQQCTVQDAFLIFLRNKNVNLTQESKAEHSGRKKRTARVFLFEKCKKREYGEISVLYKKEQNDPKASRGTSLQEQMNWKSKRSLQLLRKILYEVCCYPQIKNSPCLLQIYQMCTEHFRIMFSILFFYYMFCRYPQTLSKTSKENYNYGRWFYLKSRKTVSYHWLLVLVFRTRNVLKINLENVYRMSPPSLKFKSIFNKSNSIIFL